MVALPVHRRDPSVHRRDPSSQSEGREKLGSSRFSHFFKQDSTKTRETVVLFYC